MAPAANARPIGSIQEKASTKKKEATAMNGCGTLVSMAIRDARGAETPRGTSTSATARPSGTLWTASSSDMKMPNCASSRLLKATPTATPSAAEWQNMTVKMSSAFRMCRRSMNAWCRTATSASSSPSSLAPPERCSLARMKTTPTSSPANICQSYAPECSCASSSMLTEAESIVPPAAVLASASVFSSKSLGRAHRNGTAPRPVVTHVNRP
mmetsp:Transcript_9149/g.24302  ORF Transcript_9149/g.24302 Transcript_9149/m.24302 type:complete len:212 (+) Transcript_9149:218-853(+)